jgi:plastocyanin
MRRCPTVFALALCLAALLALTIVGCSSGSSGGTSAGGATITLENIAFNPASSTVKVGDSIMFINKDSMDHHVFVGTADLGVQPSGALVTWKATTAGDFPLKCVIHPSMTGVITVK